MTIKYLGAPIKEGCTIKGADQGMAPLAELFAFADIVRVNLLPEDDDKHLLYLNTVTDFLQRLRRAEERYADAFTVTLGGDHSLAIASIAAHYRKGRGIIWVDSHGDSNTDQTTISGRIHGMPLSVLQGLGAKKLTDICKAGFYQPEDIILFGISSLDPLEERLINDLGIKMITYDDIRTKGLDACLAEAVCYLAGKEVYLSYDLDSIDPQVCTGVNTPVQVGLSAAQAYQVMDTILGQMNIIGMDLVEYNPLNDDGNTIKLIRDFKAIIEKYKG